MRLICPNCDAQYEVPVDVIPKGGRDVQCSNCAHTWFQNHPDDAAEAERAAQEAISALGRVPAPAAVDDIPASPPPPAAAPVRRSLDPSVEEVLRQEAELEARARAAEALESQPELGLEEPNTDEQARHARESRELLARMRNAQPATPPPANPAPALPQTQSPSEVAAELATATAARNRRDVLPDVEEINQSLRSTNEPRKVVDSQSGRVKSEGKTAPRSGFGPGFLLVVILAVLAIAAYVYADQIAAAVPQLAPMLESYVTMVNGLRDWLDARVTQVLTMLDGMSSEASDPAAAADGTAEPAPAPSE